MKKAKYITPASKLDDPDMQGVPAALMRALKRAHKIAHDTNTGVVVMIDGKVTVVPPDPELYNDVSDLYGYGYQRDDGQGEA